MYMISDFVVRFDPKVDSEKDLMKRILNSVILSRIKNKKPTIIAVTGDSGEGKSFSTLRIMELLSELQGYDYSPFVDDTNVYTPIEYPKKMEKLLGLNKKGFEETGLKKVNFIAIHEARTLVSAKNWQSFVNVAISDVNAMSRSIKRLVFFIVSQFIKDIDKSIRNTLTYYLTVQRPKGRNVRLKFHVLWKDDRDIENPRLRKRKLSGHIIYPSGRYVRYSPSYFELSKPSPEVVESFEKSDTEAKAKILKQKLEKLMKEIEKDMDIDTSAIKVDNLVKHLQEHPEQIKTFGKISRKKWKLTPNAREMFDLTTPEIKMFEDKMNKDIQGDYNGTNQE